MWHYQRSNDGWKRPTPDLSSSNAVPVRAEPPAETPPLRMGADIIAPVVLHRVAVRVPKDHPSTMRRADVILFEGIVTTHGDFQNVKVIKGADDSVAPYALEAVRRWKFRPAMKAGKPVAVIYHVAANIDVR